MNREFQPLVGCGAFLCCASGDLNANLMNLVLGKLAELLLDVARNLHNLVEGYVRDLLRKYKADDRAVNGMGLPEGAPVLKAFMGCFIRGSPGDGQPQLSFPLPWHMPPTFRKLKLSLVHRLQQSGLTCKRIRQHLRRQREPPQKVSSGARPEADGRAPSLSL